MTFFLTCPHSINSSFRRILWRNKCFSPLLKKMASFPSSLNKYDGIRSRLEAIPCTYLLNKQADRFQHDLWCENDERLKDLQKWCSKVFKCNTRTSILIYGSAFLKAYCTFGFSMTDTTWNQWDSDGWRSAVILAWFLEITSSYMNMIDDMVDQSNMRRGKLCWYKEPDIGLSATHDAIALLWSGFKLLQKYLAGLNCYLNVIEECQQANIEFAFGQVLDTISRIKQNSRIDSFTFERYQVLAEYKGGQYICRLPIHLAMHLAGGYSKEEFEFTRKICLKLALYYQIQNDRFDYVYPLEQTGLRGNDIRNGSLTWFAVKFLEDASVPMKKQFLENYGSSNEDAIDTVLELYKGANMLEKFQEYEEKLSTEIFDLIESIDDHKGAFFLYVIHHLQYRTN